MKWAIVAVCLTCSVEPEPTVIATIPGIDRETCERIAAIAEQHANAGPDRGLAWCAPIDDWQADEPYPQVKR